MRTYVDQRSGAQVRCLIDYKGHHHHLYFTNPGWWDGGRRLLVGGDRAGRTNLFSVELATGELEQLTDLPDHAALENSFLFASVNPTRDEVYFWWDGQLHALDLQSRQQHQLFTTPAGMAMNMTNVSADGAWVYTAVYEDLSDRLGVDLLHGYKGFREYFAADPLSQIWRIPTTGGQAELVYEKRMWIGHVNTSPTRPELLTFCHEGPWELVPNRIWGLDVDSGRAWQIRPTEAGEGVGHEYWLADGETIGYHGRVRDEQGVFQPVFGFASWDNQEVIEAAFPTDSHHFHSNTRELIIGDGPHRRGEDVLLWRFDGERFSRPRVLCRHRSSAHVQQTHVHPRLSPDGRQAVFTSDDSGYGSVYVVDLPPWEDLPELSSD